jgi:hypothetical protein
VCVICNVAVPHSFACLLVVAYLNIYYFVCLFFDIESLPFYDIIDFSTFF